MKKIFATLVLSASLVACGQAEQERANKLQAEVAKLQGEISALRAELEAQKNGPERLLAKAMNQMSESNLAPAKQALSDLIARYPESEQAKSAKAALIELNAKMAAAEKAKLLEAEMKAEEQRQIIARLDANLKKDTDEIKGITWITHKSEPILADYMSLYFATKDGVVGSYPLRVKFHYYSDSWLFVRSVTIKADDQVFNLPAVDFERDHSSGKIWEWSDTKVDDMAMLNSIIASKKVVIRYNGRQYYHDFILPELQKAAMKEMLVAWQRYGGKA